MEYWTNGLHMNAHAIMEIRASIALYMIEHWGLVSGKSRNPDAGEYDPGLTLMKPDDVVNRAFALAEYFVDEAERRGYIRENLSEEEQSRRAGYYDNIRERERYKMIREEVQKGT